MTALQGFNILEIDELSSGMDSYIKNNHLILNSKSDLDTLDVLISLDKKMDMVYISVEDYLKFNSDVPKFTSLHDHSAFVELLTNIILKSKTILSESGVFVLHVKDKKSLGFRELISKIMLEQNYITTFVWDNGQKTNNLVGTISNSIEYFYTYAKDISKFQIQQKKISVLDDSSYTLQDEFIKTRGMYKLIPLDTKAFTFSKERSKPFMLNGNMLFAGGSESEHRKNIWTWVWDIDKIKDRFEKGFVVIQKDSKNKMRLFKKQYQLVSDSGEDVVRKINYNNHITDSNNFKTKKEYNTITGITNTNLVSKDVLKYITKALTNSESYILNLSAFYGTLSASCMELNYEEHSSRTVYNSFSDISNVELTLKYAISNAIISYADIKDSIKKYNDVFKVLDFSEIHSKLDFMEGTDCYQNLIKYLSGKNPLAKPSINKNVIFTDATISVFNIFPHSEGIDLFDIDSTTKHKIISTLKIKENLHYKNIISLEGDSFLFTETHMDIYLILFKPSLSLDDFNKIQHYLDNSESKPISIVALNSVLNDSKLASKEFNKYFISSILSE